ncbi:hypothetical protein [Catenuloplanes indicus]|uniref:Uncharacterized protein n=1 Tax=Catenuloplanes indicus TaxID=137267 RepID=A0AAE3VTL2_9ACTN|nr:hypothetical protein [Catenuloplanes indicus]MDQ0363417.1 hypothetical protein [Catenuloplanes indicus]
MTDTANVRPNQLWADNDPRSAGRTLRVVSVDGDYAECVVETNATDIQHEIDNPTRTYSRPTDRRGKTVRIKTSRMQPTSTGYRLERDA